VSARLPVSRPLLNQVVRSALGTAAGHVRDVDIRPHAGDTFDVLITVSWPFVPTITVKVDIERQPDFPSSPVLVLRWSLLPGLGLASALASRFIASLDRLPAGVRLDGDRLLFDISRLAGHASAGAWLPFIRSLELHTVDDRVVLDVQLEIDSSPSFIRP
jgi:hypothetical protein